MNNSDIGSRDLAVSCTATPQSARVLHCHSNPLAFRDPSKGPARSSLTFDLLVMTHMVRFCDFHTAIDFIDFSDVVLKRNGICSFSNELATLRCNVENTLVPEEYGLICMRCLNEVCPMHRANFSISEGLWTLLKTGVIQRSDGCQDNRIRTWRSVFDDDEFDIRFTMNSVA